MKGGLCCALFAAQGRPRRRRAPARTPERRQRRGRGGRRHRHAGDDPAWSLGRRRRGRGADRLHVVTAQAGSLDVPSRRARALGARLRARGRRQRGREVRAAARGAAAARGRALRSGGRLGRRSRRSVRVRRRRPARQPLFAGYRLPWPIEVGTLHAGDWAEQRPRHAGGGGTLRRRRRRGCRRGPAGVRRGDRSRRRGRPLACRASARRRVVGRALRPGRHRPGRPYRHRGDRAPRRTSPARRLRSRASPTAPTCACSSTSGRIPTVLFGPGDVRVAHMPDEYVPLEELARGRRGARPHRAALLRRRASRPAGRPDTVPPARPPYVQANPLAPTSRRRIVGHPSARSWIRACRTCRLGRVEVQAPPAHAQAGDPGGGLQQGVTCAPAVTRQVLESKGTPVTEPGPVAKLETQRRRLDRRAVPVDHVDGARRRHRRVNPPRRRVRRRRASALRPHRLRSASSSPP